MSDRPTVDTITSDQLDNLHAQVAGWRRKAVDRALRISRLTGTIQAVNDLAHERPAYSTPWGAGYLAAIADLREVLREFGALTDPDPIPGRDTGPAAGRCCGKPAGAVCVHDVPQSALPEPTSDQDRDELAAALGSDRAATVIAHTLHMYGRTLVDVQVMSDDELRAIPGIGDTSLTTIRTRLGHWAAPEAAGPDRCCVCGGGPVVYRNYRAQPFCWPCAACECGQDRCVRTDINARAVPSTPDADLLASARLRAKECEQERDQVSAVLAEVLATFVHKVPGHRIPRVRSGEVDVVTLGKWRSVIQHDVERPWWMQLGEAQARVRRLETAIREVLDICGDHGSDVQDILRPALEEAEQAKDRWALELIDVLADLDRCEHGRHEGDECGSCGGPSLGNPRVGPDRVIGYSRYATPIVLPARDHKHEPAAWRQTTTKDHT